MNDIPKNLNGYYLKKESKCERLQLLIRPILKKALVEEAKSQNKSINALINDVLESYLGIY